MSALRPDWVDIGPHRYQVQWDQASIDAYRVQAQKSGVDGRISQDELVITIGPSKRSYQQLVLLHELLHGVLMQAGNLRPTAKMTDDEAICLLENGLLSVLQRNPRVVAYLCAIDDPSAQEAVA